MRAAARSVTRMGSLSVVVRRRRGAAAAWAEKLRVSGGRGGKAEMEAVDGDSDGCCRHAFSKARLARREVVVNMMTVERRPRTSTRLVW